MISDFFNPLSSLPIYFIWFSSKNYSWEESLHRFLPISFIIIIPISIWILWNVKTKRYSNIDVSDRNQRKSLYFFIISVMSAYLIFEYFRNGKLDLVMLFIMVLLLMMQFSNYFIKSSMHTAFNVFVSALFFSQDTTLGILWFFISVLVGISRIILKRHSPKEVFMGAFIALVASFAYLYTNIQMNS